MFDEVTFWAPKAHKHYVLKHRIDRKEVQFLQNYLCPNLTKEDRERIEKIREDQKRKSFASLDNTKDADDFDPFGGLQKDEEEYEDKDSDGGLGEDNQNDSDFVEELDRVVNLSDVDQNFKGDNINSVGQLASLGKDHKSKLRLLDYDDGEAGDLGEKEPNKFIEAQQRKKKLDEQMNPEKHLLPKEICIPGTKTKHNDDFKLPFPSIDIIFNHKNIWANLQNPDP